MRKLITIMVSLALAFALVASPAAAKTNGKADRNKSDFRPNARAQKEEALRQKGRDMVLAGKATAKGDNQVVKIAKGQYVELAFEGEDQILTLLGEFGEDQPEPSHNHGALGVIDHGGAPGPLHNQIPEPDRSVDNTTIWEPDFTQEYYDALLYDETRVPSMANWYLKSSDGRYSVDGFVSDWNQLPYNAATYGSNYCGSNVCLRDVGRFIEDTADSWWENLVAEQGSVGAANEFLSQFDIWDRYDWDHDGNFDEPDGYIDHFQAVHAGEGEETGGGAQGADAIWSHRSNVVSVPFGTDGPMVGDDQNFTGGAKIGASNYWIDDYTVEPENGGVGVFVHEFGHDLNLPDLYDTGGNTGFGENSTAWWTTWSQGSYGTIDDSLGNYPVHATAWEKFVFGWLNYEVAFAGDKASYKLSAIEINTKKPQAVFIVLPDKEVSVEVGEPWDGHAFYHSGSGNDLNNTMTKSVTLGDGPITMSFETRYHIEPCWDYAFLEVSTNGTDWTPVHTSESDDPALDVNGQNIPGEGISDVSGTPKACDDINGLVEDPTVVTATADLSAWENQTIDIRFRYWTDGATVGEGFGVDNIEITGLPVDDAESDFGWTFDGFAQTDGTVTSTFPNYYVLEYRTYRGYDKALREGPYNFDNPAGNFVTHFPYQDGLLIWYWDLSQADNNVSQHPGEGYLLPIDASPAVRHWSGSGDVVRPRINAYDSTFGTGRTDAFSLTSTTLGTLNVASHAGVRTFNDNNSYYVASDPADATSDWKAGWNSVRNPHTGTVVRVANTSAHGQFMQILLNP